MSVLLLAMLVGLAAVLSGGAGYPEMACKSFSKPLIHCEARGVFPPQTAEWSVYSAGAVRDYDLGRVVFLTVPPNGEKALVEMTYIGASKKPVNVSVWAKWNGLTLQFFKYKGTEPCGNFKPCA